MSLLDGAELIEEDELAPPPKPPAEIPATRCGCVDCKDRVENPKAYWDRVTTKIVREYT